MKLNTPQGIEAVQADPFYLAQVHLAVAQRLIMRGREELKHLRPYEKLLHKAADAESEKTLGQWSELQNLSHALIAARTLPIAEPGDASGVGRHRFTPSLPVSV